MNSGVLVTGGAGFIGSNFVLHWVGSGMGPVVNVDALTYASNPANLASLEGNADYSFVHGNICDAELMAATLAKHRPRAIVTFCGGKSRRPVHCGTGSFPEDEH